MFPVAISPSHIAYAHGTLVPSRNGLARLALGLARHFGVSPTALAKATRGDKREVLARQCVIYLAHVALGFSVSALARHFGRDRATIRNALRRIEDKRDDAAFDRLLDALTHRFTLSPEGQPMTQTRKKAAATATSALLMVKGADGEEVAINLNESPLQWLATRKDAKGRAYLDANEVLAGERFRLDFTFAGLQPVMTAQWGSPLDGGRRGPEALNMTDTLIAARERLSRVAKALGPEFFGLLTDVCGFLKPLQEVEATRGWPVRSGKLVLKLALASLARHYGLESEAKGPARSRGIRAFRETASTG